MKHSWNCNFILIVTIKEVCRSDYSYLADRMSYSCLLIHYGHICEIMLLIINFIAAAQEPGWVTVTLKSQYGIPLGETKLQYVDEEDEFLQRVVNEPSLQCKLFKKLQVNAETAGGNETQHSGNTGKTVLCCMTVVVYSMNYLNTETLLREQI